MVLRNLCFEDSIALERNELLRSVKPRRRNFCVKSQAWPKVPSPASYLPAHGTNHRTGPPKLYLSLGIFEHGAPRTKLDRWQSTPIWDMAVGLPIFLWICAPGRAARRKLNGSIFIAGVLE